MQQKNNNEETLYLIDGYAALFRAFYAIRNPLRSSVTGEPTNAILVFAQMLLKLYATFNPDYVVVAWDAPGKTFRDALFAEYAQQATPLFFDTPTDATATTATPLRDVAPEMRSPVSSYKGTRRETPDSLHEQTPRILQLLELFNIPVIGVPGLEADDIIATLTTRVLTDGARPDLRVRIVTRDKDIEQLIGERVTLFDVHTGEEMGEADLWNKRGVTPQQVVDLLALTGDVVDNIPGVPGVGPKTAAKLLQQFGSLQGLINALENASSENEPLSIAPGKVAENLERARPMLPISRRLVTLEREANLVFDLEQARARPIPVVEIAQFCDELGLVTLKKRCLSYANISPQE